MRQARLYNERPSAVLNIGNDIPDAARHRNDTYETPEAQRTKQFKRQSKTNLKQLKADAIASLDESNFIDVINTYELNKYIQSNESLASFTAQTADVRGELKTYLTNNRQLQDWSKVASGFNRLISKQRRNRWRIRSLDDATKYFEPKKLNRFVEENGCTSLWSTDQTLTAAQTTRLASLVAGVQFGNSLPDSERVYCSVNLLNAIDAISTVLTVDLTTMGFSYGARGKAGSAAHYEPSTKALAFNRHRDGCLLHELGHAVDFQMNMLSKGIPSNIRNKYTDKINAHPLLNYDAKQYYKSSVELFARLFEQFIAMKLDNRVSSFVYFVRDASVMPELDADVIAWLNEVLQPVLVGKVG